MKDYEDFLLERVQNLTAKLAQKQREGSLAEELALCVRLALLHTQLGCPRAALQFWQSCMQIGADLEEDEEIWRAAAEISKIYCSSGLIEAAEAFLHQHLNPNDEEISCEDSRLHLVLLQVDVIMAMGRVYGTKGAKIHEFEAYERALKLVDEALERNNSNNSWWWDAVLTRGQILGQLGRFDETRIEEALEVIKTIKPGENNFLLGLKINLLLSKIYFELREYAASLDFAVSAIDLYKSNSINSNFRPRKRVYCEVLLQAGRCLRFQKDFEFAMENLLLSREEVKAVGVESELMDEIDAALQSCMKAKAAADEAATLERRLSVNASPKDLEELADLYEEIGDYSGQAELLERCHSVAVSDATKKRLNRKLINLYVDRAKNWPAVCRIYGSADANFQADWRNLLMKGRACEKLSRFQEAEESFLLALQNRNSADLQAAIYFHYLFRGQSMKAQRYRDEALSLEAVEILKRGATCSASASGNCPLIDPNFSYFATRKPSNSLMKMVGSGMVMKTKTRKTKGLELKRRRGGASGAAVAPKVNRKRALNIKAAAESDEDGLSDFIVSEEEVDLEIPHRSTKAVGHFDKKAKSILIFSSSSESEDDEEVKSLVNKSRFSSGFDNNASSNSLFTQNDSPLLIRTNSLSVINNSNSNEIRSDSQPQIKNDIKKVVVRIKKGIEFVVPVTEKTGRVDELLREAQKRFEKLFPQDFNRMGVVKGLSLGEGMLFPEDELSHILSRDSETLVAHFDTFQVEESCKLIDSPSSFSRLGGLEEDFRRKLQVLNLKPDSAVEISSLRELQNRFRACRDELNLSGLALDSLRLAEYSGLLGKFGSNSGGGRLTALNLSENYLCDGDLKTILGRFTVGGGPSELLNLSMNFLHKPSARWFQGWKIVDLSYNPIDLDWLANNAASFEWGINLIGCFDRCEDTCDSRNEIEFDWSILGHSLSKLRRLQFSFPDERFEERYGMFLKALCGESSRLEELSVFGVDWSGRPELMLELSYLRELKELNLTACRFNGNLGPIFKILKRCGSLKKLILAETDISEDEFKEMKLNNENDYRSLSIEM